MVVAVLYLSLKEKEHYRKIDPFSFDQLYYSGLKKKKKETVLL